MISVVGLGTGNSDHLCKAATLAISSCQLLIGSTRQQKIVHSLLNKQAHQVEFPSPFHELSSLLAENTDRDVVILASGDPLFFGIGTWLCKQFDHSQLCFYPNISSIQTAFSRIKQAWQHANIVSLHGRPLISLRPQLRNNQWYGILTDKNSFPANIAQELQQHGFEQSKLWVCEALGSDDERVRLFSVDELLSRHDDFHFLHITLIYTQGRGGILPEFPGISDELFKTGHLATKGMITKKQVRLAALTLLQTCANDVCWDIGAGCGGLSVEWAYWHPQSHIYAIESHENRIAYLQANREKFGVVKNLHVFKGTAPFEVLDGIPKPHKIFVGGSGEFLLKILITCWENYLASTGCIVVSCVTETSKYETMKFIEQYQLQAHVEKIEISTATAVNLADKELLRPALPVQLIKISKQVIQ